jgi:trigger factor
MPGTSPKPYSGLKVTKTNDGMAEIEAVIPVETLQPHMDAAFKKAQLEFVLPGFRKGMVPDQVFKQYANRMELLEQAAEPALTEAYHAIIADEKLEPIGHPQVAITKMAPGNPLAFKVTVPLMPDFKLPDYKKIAKRIMDDQHPVTVADDEVEKTIADIMRLREQKQAPAAAPAENVPEAEKTAEPGSAPSAEEKPLLELTDEYVKKLGAFENVADFKAKLKASLLEEKQREEGQHRRELIAKHLAGAVKFDVPKMFIDQETEAMKRDREEQVKHLGIKMEEYLKKINKTEEKIAAEEREYAERQLKTRFIFEKIAEAEKFTAAPEEVAQNLEAVKRQHPGAHEEDLRRYIAAMIVNEKVLRLLEGRLPGPNSAPPANPPLDKNAAGQA